MTDLESGEIWKWLEMFKTYYIDQYSSTLTNQTKTFFVLNIYKHIMIFFVLTIWIFEISFDQINIHT